MSKKSSTGSNLTIKNKIKVNKKLKNILSSDNFNFGNNGLKRNIGLSLSEELYVFLKKKSKQEDISMSAIISKLVMVFAKSEGIDIEVGNVRKMKKKKPE